MKVTGDFGTMLGNLVGNHTFLDWVASVYQRAAWNTAILCAINVPRIVQQFALTWCLAVQECALYVDWSTAILHHWLEESGEGGRPLFRGPR